jgi:hypothetical protein
MKDPLTGHSLPQHNPEFVGGYGLTQKEVTRLREILARECGVQLTSQEAWGRAIEVAQLLGAA